MIGHSLDGRYEILDVLGQGGMGVVYRARDPRLGREVAIKVLAHDALPDDAEERFRREARLIAQMDHPAIVPIFDLGQHEGAVYYVMPVLEGRTVHERLRDGTLELGEILEIGIRTAEALDHSHQRGVIHRDVKPANVMVSRVEERLRVRVMDFGLALEESMSRLTLTGNLPGTLTYLSPEQILQKPVDARSDLYSLGTVLYECLAGRPPFSGAIYSLLYKIVHEPPSELAALGVDEALAAVVVRCLEKEPEKRPARGRDLALLLRRCGERLGAATTPAATPTGTAPGSTPSDSAPSPSAPSSAPSSLDLPLVGRRRELAELHRRLEAARGGECQLVLLGGDAGLGKTRLLRELERQATALGMVVAEGRCSDAGPAQPYQGLVGLVGAEDGEAGSGWDGAAVPGDPRRFFEGLARALGRRAGGGPALYLVEHLHLAPPAAEALSYLVRRMGPTSTLLVATYRPAEVPLRLARTLSGWRDEPRITRLRLAPFDADDVHELVRALVARWRLDDADPEVERSVSARLHAVTEGNPLFVQELVRALLAAGTLHRDELDRWVFSAGAELGPELLPETLQHAVEARLERLPQALVTLLRTASVLGRSFDVEDLRSLLAASQPEPVAVAAFEDAVEALIGEGWLDEPPARSRELQFASSVAREVLYGGLSRRQRRRWHRLHAEALTVRHASPPGSPPEPVLARLVHHWAAAGCAEETVREALCLARSAAGWEVRAEAARQALVVVDEVEDRRAEGDLRLHLAEALAAAGQHEAALREAVRALRILRRRHDLEAAARAALLAAGTAWKAGRIDETRRYAELGLDLAEDPRAPAAARGVAIELHGLASTLANLRGEHPRARLHQERLEALRAVELGGETPRHAGGHRGGTLVATLPQAPTTFDPARFETVEDAEILANVFETLLTTDAAGHLVPGLCESWRSDESGATFELCLDPRARFSNGEPVAADDVRRSLERSFARAGYATAAGAVVRELEVVDRRTLRVRLGEPLPLFPAFLSDLKMAVTRQEESGALLGTGPFRIAGEEAGGRPAGGPGDRLVLERNATYWRGPGASLDRVELRVGSSDAEISSGLVAGEIDVARDLAPDQLDFLLRRRRFRHALVEATQKSTWFVAWNCRGPLARHGAVRRALSRTLATQDLVWRTLGWQAQPAVGFIPPGVLGHDPGRRPQRLGRDAARRLLDEARCELPRRLIAAVHPLFADRYGALLAALRDEWAALGVAVEVETTSLESYLARWRSTDEVDLLIGRWLPDYDDPDNVIYIPFHSRHGHLGSWLPTAAADPLMERARHERRDAVRRDLYQRVEELFAEHDAVVPLFHGVEYRLVGPRVRKLRFAGHPPAVCWAEVVKLPRPPRPQPAAVVRPVRVALPGRFDRLDPAQAELQELAEVVPNVFETLTRVGEAARIVPGLAAEIQPEDGARRWRLRLREGVRFHDGRRLTVRDVRSTFERLLRLRPERPEPALEAIRGGREFAAGAAEIVGFKILSTAELVLELEEPLVFYPAMLTRPALAIVPEGGVDGLAAWDGGGAGTGPFRIASYLPGKRVELEAHSRSGDARPRIERLIFELGVPGSDAARRLADGSLDVASRLGPMEVERLGRTPGVRRLEAPGLSTYYLILQRHHGPFADPSLRRAFVTAFDTAAMTRATVGHLATPARGWLPPGLLGHGPPERSGRPSRHEPFGPLKLRVAAHPSYGDVYAAFWRRFLRIAASKGVEATVSFLAPAELLDPRVRGQFDLVASRWSADYPDSHSFLQLLDSRSGLEGTVCGLEEVDRRIERGRAETDPTLRHALYREVEELLAREALLVPLFHEQLYRCVREEVGGLRLCFGFPEVDYAEIFWRGVSRESVAGPRG